MSFFLGQRPRMLLSPRCFSWLISWPLSTLKYHSIRKRPPRNTLPKTVSLFCLLTLYLASCKHMGKYEYRHGYRFFDIWFISLSRMQSRWRQGFFFFFLLLDSHYLCLKSYISVFFLFFDTSQLLCIKNISLHVSSLPVDYKLLKLRTLF